MIGLCRRRTGPAIAATALVVMPIWLVAQQRDAGTAAARVGSAEISGVVASPDNPPQPVRRAVVTLTGGGLNPRSVLTDETGRFTFGRLPAGTYNVTSRKAAYLAAPYGARRPGRAGMPIVVADGQRNQVAITMFRGSVITGVLRDAAGLPVSGVDVRAIDARVLPTMTSDTSTGDVTTTDDRGVFRMYGLLPGDYLVVALPMPAAAGAIVAPAISANDAALAALAARLPPATGRQTPTPSPLPSPQTIGYAPIFFPGTPRAEMAAPVHVDAGQERGGVDFELRALPTAAIEGTVRGDVSPAAGAQITIIPLGPQVANGLSSNSLSGHGIDAEGRFRYANLPPGRYRLVARTRRASAIAAAPSPTPAVGAAGGGRSGGPANATEYLYGFTDVTLDGQDVTGVELVLQPGGSISGRMVFTGSDATPRPADLSTIRISLSQDNGTGMVSSGGLTMGSSLIVSSSSSHADGTFEIKGIGPSRFNLVAQPVTAGEASSWKVRSAIAGDRDLLDDGLEMGPGVDLRNVVVTFSDARTEISGTLQGATGELVTEYYIVALPGDRSLWRPKSRRILYVRPGTDGRFVFNDPPSGEYILAVVTDLDPIDLMSQSFLEPLAAAGAKVTLREGEKTVQNLRVR